MHAPKDKEKKVIAVIVTFFPKKELLAQSIDSLLGQCNSIIIVDNTPTSNNDELKNFVHRPNIQIISLQKNLGIAHAQNIGIQKCIDFDANFVLLMDQDSIPESVMVGKLHAVFEACEHSNIIAVGPSYIDPRSRIKSYFMVSKFGLPFRYKPNKKTAPLAAVNVVFLISSGTLISIPNFLRVGGMRSNYFIDHVDTEWCLRALSKGFTLVGLHSAIMEHSLGDKVKRFWLFYLRSVAYHSPLRDYYMFRNTLLMLRDTNIPTLWASFLILRLVQFAAYFLILANNRKQRMRAMLLGIKHGIQNVSGEVDLQTGKCTNIPKTLLDPI